VSPERLESGALYPSQAELREVSFAIARAVVRCARDSQVGRRIRDDHVEEAVRGAIWHPEYIPIVPKDEPESRHP
jgi:hypothetical protein